MRSARRDAAVMKLITAGLGNALDPVGTRFFSAGAEVRQIGEVTDAISDAYDILEANGMSPQTAADMVLAAERSGRDPVAFARHLVSLRQAMQR